MKKINRNILANSFIFFLLMSIYSSLYSQQLSRWPAHVDASTHTCKIVGTVGEYRNTGRFHQGVDFSRHHTNPTQEFIQVYNPGHTGPGKNNYIIDSGLGTGPNYRWVDIKDEFHDRYYRFRHIVLNSNWPSKEDAGNTNPPLDVLEGEHFTDMKTPWTGAHLHFEMRKCEDEGTCFNDNPLFYLPGYTDDKVPLKDTEYMGLKGFRMHRNGLTRINVTDEIDLGEPELYGKSHQIISNKIDIQVHLIDRHIGFGGAGTTTGECAPYSIDFAKYKSNLSQNVEQYEPISEIQCYEPVYRTGYSFQRVPKDANANFAFGPQSWGDIPFRSISILTSDPFNTPHGRYWNTMLKKNYNQTFPVSSESEYSKQNARDNREANYPDGSYFLNIRATDFRGNNQFGSWAIERENSRVIIDNFRPYVKEVKMKINNHQATNKWDFNNVTSKLNLHKTSFNNDFVKWFPNTVKYTVRFNEPMRPETVKAVLKVSNGSGSTTTYNSGETINSKDTLFIFSYNVTLNSTTEVKACLEIEGMDYANNPLTAMQNMVGFSDAIPTVEVVKKTEGGINWNIHDLHLPTGKDLVHCFSISECADDNLQAGGSTRNEGECFTAEFDYEIQEYGCQVEFTAPPIESGSYCRWDFGDGSTHNFCTTPPHIFSDNDCYEVTLTVTKNNVSVSHTEEICIDNCFSDPPPLSDCNITGPLVIPPGSTIVLTAQVSGTGPFTYDWSGSFHTTFISQSGNTATFDISDNANNGTTVPVYLRVYDGFGSYTDCTYNLTIGGNVPSFTVTAFGSFNPNTYLSFVGFIDYFNTVGPVTYKFKIASTSGQVICESPQWSDNWGFDICTGATNFPGICLVPGPYKVTAYAKDNHGIYQAEKLFTIPGTPPPPDPPLPPLKIEIVSPLNAEITSPNSTLALKVTGQYPWEPHFGQCTVADPYTALVEFYLVDLSTGNETLHHSENLFNNYGGFLFQVNFLIPFNCTYNGSYSINAKIYYQDCRNGTILEPYTVTNSLKFKVFPSFPIIQNIAEISSPPGCAVSLRGEISGGCLPYKAYMWTFYDVNTNEVINDLGSSTTNTIDLNLDSEYFKNYPAGSDIMFNARLEMKDNNNFSSMLEELVIITAPLQINKTEYTACEGANLLIEDVVKGGSGNNTYTWSGPNAHLIASDDDGKVFHFKAPTGIPSGTPPYSVVLTVTDITCLRTVTSNIIFTVSNISITMPGGFAFICNDGYGVNRMNPVIAGGSGTYTYNWNPSIYLDAPFHENPYINIPQGNTEDLTYQLTVIDDTGCQGTGTPYTVRGGSFVPMVLLDPLPSGVKIFCFDSEPLLTARQNNNNFPYSFVWTYLNGEMDPFLGKDFTIPPHITQSPGIHTFKVTGTDPMYGCIRELEVPVTIQQRMKYVGYETAVRVAVQNGINSDIQLWKTPSNQNKMLVNMHSGIPLENTPLNYTFMPSDPWHVEAFNSNGVPSKGSLFNSSLSLGDFKMKVTNDKNCSVDIPTNRWAVIQDKPTVIVTRLDEGISMCGQEVCFKVTIMSEVIQNPHYMPSNLTGAFRAIIEPWNPSSYSTSGTFQLNQENEPGVYTGEFCFIGPSTSVSHTRIDILANLDPSLLVNTFSFHDFGSEVFLSPTAAHRILYYPNNWNDLIANDPDLVNKTVCETPPYAHPTSAIKFATTLNAATLSGCSYTYVPDGHNVHYYGMGYDGRLNISNLIVDEGGEFFGYINQCISNQAGFNETEILNRDVNSKNELNLADFLNVWNISLYPNPSSGHLNIDLDINENSDLSSSRFSLKIVDIFGKLQRNIMSNHHLGSGNHKISLDISDRLPGIYILICENQETRESKIIKFIKI